jgi:hypothetical protein
MDVLTLEPTTRGVDPPKREVRYLRFLINGVDPFDGVVDAGDRVTPLQPGSSPWHKSQLAMLTGERGGELPSGRVPLLICGECGDIGCGAVGAFVEIGPETVVWSGFAYENHYESAMTTDYSIGPFQFNKEQYLRTIIEAQSPRAQ